MDLECPFVYTHNIYVDGMTFRGATYSIELLASSIGSYTFRNCLWEENSRVLFAVACVGTERDKTLKFQNCYFIVSSIHSHPRCEKIQIFLRSCDCQRNKGYIIKGFYLFYADFNLRVDNCVFLENQPDPVPELVSIDSFRIVINSPEPDSMTRSHIFFFLQRNTSFPANMSALLTPALLVT